MPADPSAAWDSSNIARSEAERLGRYAPEFDTDKPRPVPACREPVGMTD